MPAHPDQDTAERKLRANAEGRIAEVMRPALARAGDAIEDILTETVPLEAVDTVVNRVILTIDREAAELEARTAEANKRLNELAIGREGAINTSVGEFAGRTRRRGQVARKVALVGGAEIVINGINLYLAGTPGGYKHTFGIALAVTLLNILCGYGMGTAIAALVRKPSRRWSRIGFWSLGLLSVPFALATNAAMAGMQTLAKQGWPVILKAIVNRDLGPLIQHLEPMSMFFALISILFGFFVVLFVVRAWTQATPDGIDRLEKLIAKERALAAEDRADTHDHIISMAEEAKEELKQLPEEARDMVSHMSNKLGKVEGRLADFARKQHRICKTHEGSMAIHRRALLNSLPGPHPTYVSQNPDLSSLVIAAAKQDLVREHVNAQWKALTTLGSLVHDGLLLIEQHRQAALGLPRANEGLADDRNEPVFPNWLDDDDGLQRRSAAPPPTLTDAAE